MMKKRRERGKVTKWNRSCSPSTIFQKHSNLRVIRISKVAEWSRRTAAEEEKGKKGGKGGGKWGRTGRTVY